MAAMWRRSGRGTVRVRRVPWPGWLAAVSVPLCACASSAAIASPIPLPEVWAAAWPRQNRSETRGSSSAGMPIPVSATSRLVNQALRAALAERAPDVTGLSCLADGADQIFARAVTDLGGTLEAVIPAAEYREKLLGESHPGYDDLFARAAAVLRCRESTPESHMAASKLMVDQADELYAVWDGKPARAYGGTADVVAYAREHGTPVRVIWPNGAQRD